MRISEACKLRNVNAEGGNRTPTGINPRRILRTLRISAPLTNAPRNLNNISTHISIAKTDKQTIYDSFRHIETCIDASMMPVIFIKGEG